MTEDLRHDLLELPPSMDLPDDFYDRVMHKARRRQRGMRAATAGFAAAVIAAIVVGGMTLTDASSVDRIVPDDAVAVAERGRADSEPERLASRPRPSSTPSPVLRAR